MKEIWKDIKGYEGLYQVSNKLRVKSLDRVITHKNGKKFVHKGRILSTFKNGYYKTVHLWKNNIEQKKLVHRLAAEAFLPNPCNKPFIDHIIPLSNGGKDNLDNLRWCTQKENMNNVLTIQKMKNSFMGRKHSEEWKKNNSKLLRNNPKISKQVYQYTLENDLINVYPSISEISRKLGFNDSAICRCCNGKIKKYKGYKWSYNPL